LNLFSAPKAHAHFHIWWKRAVLASEEASPAPKTVAVQHKFKLCHPVRGASAWRQALRRASFPYILTCCPGNLIDMPPLRSHAKRVTIMPKDIQLARRIRGERA
jgi:hypothetical protein